MRSSIIRDCKLKCLKIDRAADRPTPIYQYLSFDFQPYLKVIKLKIAWTEKWKATCCIWDVIKKIKERIVYTVYLLNSTRQYIIETIYAYNYLSLKWHARDLTRTNITRQNHSNIHSLNISLPLRSDRDQQKKKN